MNVALFTAFKAVSFTEISHKIKDAFEKLGMGNVKIYDIEKNVFVPNISFTLPIQYATWDLMILTMTVAPNAADAFHYYSGPTFTKQALFYGPVEGQPTLRPYHKNMLDNRLVVPSKFCKEELEKYGVRVKAIVPHGIKHSEFNVSEKEASAFRENSTGHKILYYLGNSDPRKGSPLLIETLAILKHKYTNFVCIVDTMKEGVSNVEAKPRKLKVQHFIEFNPSCGSMTRHEIAVKLSACDLFVLPSLCEGFGIPIIEAGACKHPTIAVDAPPINELITKETGYLVPFEEVKYQQIHPIMNCKTHIYKPETFAEQIQYALENDREREEKGIKAYENSLKYDYVKTYEKFLDLL